MEWPDSKTPISMLFGGFIVIAESWFELWRSEAMGAVLSAALRYGSMIALTQSLLPRPTISLVCDL
jgi:hypothetical protein